MNMLGRPPVLPGAEAIVSPPATLDDDYGNTWAKQPDDTYNSPPYTGWTREEVDMVFGLSTMRAEEAMRAVCPHNWISFRKLSDPVVWQMCNCGERRAVIEREGRQ